jgi:hypothetical protein
MWVTMAFPAWVLVVSGLFLVRAGVIDVEGDDVEGDDVEGDDVEGDDVDGDEST